MKRATLDASLDSAAAVYARLARELDFPAGFGNNLDALWDTLSGDVRGPIEIVWHDAAQARLRLGPVYDRFVALFAEVAAARADFRFAAD